MAAAGGVRPRLLFLEFCCSTTIRLSVGCGLWEGASCILPAGKIREERMNRCSIHVRKLHTLALAPN
jgi:hypothetical protein